VKASAWTHNNSNNNNSGHVSDDGTASTTASVYSSDSSTHGDDDDDNRESPSCYGCQSPLAHSLQSLQLSPKADGTKRRRRGRGGKNKKKAAANVQPAPPTLTAAEQTRYVAMDCEMVGVGSHGQISALARVSLVDWQGHILLDEYVRPAEDVRDYRTFVSGITPQHLQEASHTMETIRPLVAALLCDKILVGHGLKNDLHVLGNLSHPWYDVRDTAKYEPFMKVRFADGILWPRKLRDLMAEMFRDAHDFQSGVHSSVADAQATMRLFQKVHAKFEKIMAYKKQKTLQITQQQQQQQQQRVPQ
jgi:RNA exonuclease 4